MITGDGKTVHRGVWRPEDRAEALYRYVPVEVPAGQGGLSIELRYDRSAGVIDLGCLDPTGAFRGWSGGSKDRVTIAEAYATPGYLPGPVGPGAWQVMLGLHRVPPGGVAWEVTAGPPDPAPPRPAPAGPWPDRPPSSVRALPAPPGHRWLAGDLHAHTVHSDGTLTVPQLARLAAGSGLDFVAVTDHNTVSHHPELPGETGVILVPGQEITTDRGHANAFGDIGWIDFRRPAADWVERVRDRGGLMSINHPLAADFSWRHKLPVRPPLAEVWHSGWWDRTWGAPLAWMLPWGTATVPVGGSDFHNVATGDRLGVPTTWVLVPVDDPRTATVEHVMDALAAGRVAIGDSPAGPVLLRIGDEFVAVDADGAVLTDFSGRRRVVRGDRAVFPGEPGPHWLEDPQTQVRAIAA